MAFSWKNFWVFVGVCAGMAVIGALLVFDIMWVGPRFGKLVAILAAVIPTVLAFAIAYGFSPEDGFG